MTLADCELLPKLQHIRVAAKVGILLVIVVIVVIVVVVIVVIFVGHLESCGIIFFGNQIILASCKLLHKLQPIRVSAKVGIVIIVVIVIATGEPGATFLYGS